ncbi:hypothetical protein GOP47_0016293 [Adiantum capillus-veneris]|uniref:RING-type E3 ubiquitin transferase n=1 Tax=Adiantum capillus-veneris TaxID=13818 RepID=A0A9D4UHC9_ADICA|nr:hypothetical protein GOP47_0016293 [Adiantum capillus-veneris]
MDHLGVYSATTAKAATLMDPKLGNAGIHGDEETYRCRMCSQRALQNPIVTACGHLFCWPCFSKWLDESTTSELCPSCSYHLMMHPHEKGNQGIPPFLFVARIRAAGGRRAAGASRSPDFACGRCERAEAVQPVILGPCGHLCCWACLAPNQDPAAKKITIRCRKPECRRRRMSFKAFQQMCPIYGAKDDPVAMSFTSSSVVLATFSMRFSPFAAASSGG